MRALILSDFHAGHRSSRIEEALPLLSKAAGEFDQVFVNGDALERWEKENCTPEATAWRGRLTEALVARAGAPIFITGNHDPALSPHSWWYLEEARLLLFHGDVIGECSAPWRDGEERLRDKVRSLWTELGGEPGDFSARCEAFRREQCAFMNPWPFNGCEGAHPLRYVARNLFPPHRPLTIFSYRRRAPERVAALAARFHRPVEHVVFGHIHRPNHWRRHGMEVWNTGGFMPLSTPRPVVVEGRKVRSSSLSELGKTRFWRG